jgi:flagellar assembly factor FliW
MLIQELKINVEQVQAMGNDPLSKPADDNSEVTIESRYGPVTLNLKNAVFFPKGILGLPDCKDFCIANLPDERMSRFKLLQSLNDSKLSFVVLPLASDTPLIEGADIKECAHITQIRPDNLVILAIVSVQRTPEKTRITANVRAPIVVDTQDKIAIQYVFPNNKYQICHPLN